MARRPHNPPLWMLFDSAFQACERLPVNAAFGFVLKRSAGTLYTQRWLRGGHRHYDSNWPHSSAGGSRTIKTEGQSNPGSLSPWCIAPIISPSSDEQGLGNRLVANKSLVNLTINFGPSLGQSEKSTARSCRFPSRTSGISLCGKTFACMCSKSAPSV